MSKNIKQERANVYAESQERVQTIAKQIDAKLTPDVVFALERTLASWIAQGVMLWQLGLGLINFGYPVPMWFGYFLTPLGIMFVIYATFNFWQRLSLLEQRKPLPYDGNRIPVGIFVVLMIITLISTLIFAVMYGASERVEVTTVIDTPTPPPPPAPIPSPTSPAPVPAPVPAPAPPVTPSPSPSA